MKLLRLTMILVLVAALFSQCSDELFEQQPDLTADNNSELNAIPDLPTAAPAASFTVKIENVSTPYAYFEAGAEFGVTGGDGTPPAHPGETITVEFHAGKSHRLSFASMYGTSNDRFYAPDDEGIDLFSGTTPVTGDITSHIKLWDAGTEVDGSPQPGITESNPIAEEITAEENIEVMLDYEESTSMFTLTINVLPGSATPLSPVAWVVHYDGQMPIFTENALDNGKGLEDLAETGNAAPLGSYLASMSGYVSPFAPVAWAVHKQGQKPLFKEGKPVYDNGLERLAETGYPGDVYDYLQAEGYLSGVEGSGPVGPGGSITFSFDANVGEYLSFASMLGLSNDEFFAPSDKGIRLFEGNTPLSGEITSLVMLWDAGTELNEYPGAGIHQGGGETEEGGNVMLLDDEYNWPTVPQVLKVTIMAN